MNNVNYLQRNQPQCRYCLLPYSKVNQTHHQSHSQTKHVIPIKSLTITIQMMSMTDFTVMVQIEHHETSCTK